MSIDKFNQTDLSPYPQNSVNNQTQTANIPFIAVTFDAEACYASELANRTVTWLTTLLKTRS